MSVFGKLKQAFGFSDDENDDFYNDNESVNERAEQPKTNVSQTVKVSAPETTDLTPQIFDGVVKMINDTLPDFLKSCLDVEAQRRYIYNSLDEGVKSTLSKAMADAKTCAAGQWQGERDTLRNQIEQLKSQNKSLTDKHGEIHQQFLSAERQKRALKERVADLENQASNFEAEKEQYQLEVKSLMNKLKVTQVLDGDAAELKQEIVNLQEQLEEARKVDKSTELQQLIDAANTQLAQKEQDISSLNEQIAQLSENASKCDETQLEALQQQLANLTEQNTNLESALTALKAKEEIADAMINDLNKKTAEAIEKLKAAESSLAEKDEKIAYLSTDNNSSNQELDSLKNMLKLSNDELQAAREEIAANKEEIEQAREAIETLEEIQEMAEQFEQIKDQKDAQIASLKKDTQALSSQISYLQDENESLRKTIENNLYQQAESEKALREEIEKLKKELEKKDEVLDLSEENVTEKPQTKKRTPKISAIDESLDDTDWLVATPPPGTVTRPTPTTTDDDFGYKSPVIKQTPENSAQMSLFE